MNELIITDDMFEDLGDGRVKRISDGKIYANMGIAKHWTAVSNGLKQHTGRGKDAPDTMRPLPGSKTIATRYYERTGRNVIVEMEQQQLLCQLMFESAGQIDDPIKRFHALDKAQAAQAKFNQTYLPYLEQRLGTLRSESTVEQQRSLDDVLAGAITHEGD